MKRKRINILFTTLNILVIAGMLIHIAICYNNYGKNVNSTVNVPVDFVYLWSLAYILPLLLLNAIWDLVRKISSKKGEQADSPSADVLARAAARSKIVNIVFLVFNAVIIIIMVISENRLREGYFFLPGFFDLMASPYGVTLITLNTAWCVVHMNIKRTD